MVSSGHAKGHYNFKCKLCSVQQEWWGPHWGLRQGWAGGLWSCGFAGVWIFPEEEAALGNHSAQSSATV